MNDDFLDSHDKMQRLDRSDFNEEPCPDCSYKSNAFATMTLVAISFCLGMFALAAIKACDAPPSPVVDTCTACHRTIQAYTTYFRKAGAKEPQDLACRSLLVRNQTLMAEVAKLETRRPSQQRVADQRVLLTELEVR